MELSDFIRNGTLQLAPYVTGVDLFLSNLTDESDRDADDLELRASKPGQYIRNMLTLAVLNRLYRPEFLKAKHRLVVLPECTKNYSPDMCCKLERKNHSECTQCQPDCLVCKVEEMVYGNRIDLILEPDDIEKTAATYRKKKGTVGIVGVACVLTLISGFKATLKEKHPTQGLFLDYSSCQKHWSEIPYNTRFSLKQLGTILQIDAPEQTLEPSISGVTYTLETGPGSVSQMYDILDDLAILFEHNLADRYIAASTDIYEAGLAIINDLTN